MYHNIDKIQKYPNIDKIQNYLDPSCFVIDNWKSFYYLFKDIILFLLSIILMSMIPLSGNIILDCLIKLPIQIISGFFMWCIFVIGHDCGHETFSTNKYVNVIIGELVHSVILITPFYPWKKSHHRHHLYHNHLIKDYSHTWILLENKENFLSKKLNYIFYKLRLLFIFLLWPFYLYIGSPDGGHLLLYGRLWHNTRLREKMRGYISSSLSCISLYALISVFKYNIITYYIIPWIFYGLWLFTVTYLQHHHENIHLYNKKWSWIGGAFQTIDRDYGSLINKLSHNITDCHVIHHLFFKKIPHYNLKKATRQLIEGLKKDNLLHLYKHKITYNYFLYLFNYYSKNWYFLDTRNLD